MLEHIEPKLPRHRAASQQRGADDYLGAAVRAALDNGCHFEMILKDPHTCEHLPERFDHWARVAHETVDALWHGE